MDWNRETVEALAVPIAAVQERVLRSRGRVGRLHVVISAHECDRPPVRLFGMDVVTSRRIPAHVVQVRRYLDDSIEVVGEIDLGTPA